MKDDIYSDFDDRLIKVSQGRSSQIASADQYAQKLDLFEPLTEGIWLPYQNGTILGDAFDLENGRRRTSCLANTSASPRPTAAVYKQTSGWTRIRSFEDISKRFAGSYSGQAEAKIDGFGMEGLNEFQAERISERQKLDIFRLIEHTDTMADTQRLISNTGNISREYLPRTRLLGLRPSLNEKRRFRDRCGTGFIDEMRFGHSLVGILAIKDVREDLYDKYFGKLEAKIDIIEFMKAETKLRAEYEANVGRQITSSFQSFTSTGPLVGQSCAASSNSILDDNERKQLSIDEIRFVENVLRWTQCLTPQNAHQVQMHYTSYEPIESLTPYVSSVYELAYLDYWISRFESLNELAATLSTARGNSLRFLWLPGDALQIQKNLIGIVQSRASSILSSLLEKRRSLGSCILKMRAKEERSSALTRSACINSQAIVNSIIDDHQNKNLMTEELILRALLPVASKNVPSELEISFTAGFAGIFESEIVDRIFLIGASYGINGEYAQLCAQRKFCLSAKQISFVLNNVKDNIYKVSGVSVDEDLYYAFTNSTANAASVELKPNLQTFEILETGSPNDNWRYNNKTVFRPGRISLFTVRRYRGTPERLHEIRFTLSKQTAGISKNNNGLLFHQSDRTFSIGRTGLDTDNENAKPISIILSPGSWVTFMSFPETLNPGPGYTGYLARVRQSSFSAPQYDFEFDDRGMEFNRDYPVPVRRGTTRLQLTIFDVQ